MSHLQVRNGNCCRRPRKRWPRHDGSCRPCGRDRGGVGGWAEAALSNGSKICRCVILAGGLVAIAVRSRWLSGIPAAGRLSMMGVVCPGSLPALRLKPELGRVLFTPKYLICLVGAPRFELGTPSPPDWCANRAALRSADAAQVYARPAPRARPRGRRSGSGWPERGGGNGRRCGNILARSRHQTPQQAEDKEIVAPVIDVDDGARGGPGCLNRFSASISGASARVRLPSGVAAG
jgi:hypothetical protein